MLDVFVFVEPSITTLRLEGQLDRTSAGKLLKAWGEARNRGSRRKVVLDLGDLTAVDDAGLKLLRWLLATGGEISVAHPAIQGRIHGLVCKEQIAMLKGLRGVVLRILSGFCSGGGTLRMALCWKLCGLLPVRFRSCACASIR